MNDDPRAEAVSLSTAEDTAGQVALMGTDVDGDTLTYSLASQPEHGGASAEGNRATYTPASNYSGSDSFAYVVSDGEGGTAGGVVSIQVSPVNDAPISAEQSESMPEDVSRTLRLAGGDADGDPLTYEILDQPSRGTLSGSGADRTYTPADNYSGPDSFTYVVSDGRLRSSVATVRLTVLPVNDAPTCADASLTTDEDVAVESSAVCTDVDGGALVYSILRAPSSGTASFVDGKLRYVPNQNVHGADSLTYRVSDATLVSNVATATLTVNSVNDAPVATSVAASLDEDSTTDVTLSGTDVEGDSLTYEIVAGPANGALTGAGPSLTYAPAANFNGSDSFTYRVGDGVAFSGPATVTLSVAGVNDAPTCAGLVLATDEDVAAERDPDCLDVDGDALTYSILGAATMGTASVAAGRLRYVPDANANGEDGFTYRAADGSTVSDAAAVSVTVAPVNDAPVAEGASVTASEDEEKALTLEASDLEGDPLEYEVVSGPEHGTLTGAGDARAYTPASNYHGADSFTFRVRDGALASSVATVSITVQPVNDAPVCGEQAMSLDEDASGAIEPACTDVDGDALTLEIVDQSAKGTASVVAGKLRYVADANANGADSFTYRAGDGTVSSAVAAVSVTIAPVNDAPTCADLPLATDEDVAAQLEPACSDIEGDALTYVVGGAAKGTAAIVAGHLRYTPDADLNGSDSFTYRASDGHADSNVATVAVTVAAVNDAPTATGQTATTAEDTEKALTLGAADVDGDPLTYEIVAGPAHGTLAGSGAEQTYTPAANFNGSDSFTYRVSDGAASSGAATVALTVDSVNDAPTANDLGVATSEDTAKALTLEAGDIDGDGLAYEIVSGPAHGELSGTGPDRTYAPHPDYNGSDEFTYTVSDGSASSTVATVSLSVAEANDSPTAAADVTETAEDVEVVVDAATLLGNDGPGPPNEASQSLTVTGVGSASGGTVAYDAAQGEVRFAPDQNFHGTASFTYAIEDDGQTDGAADPRAAEGTVTVNVSSVNDDPVAADAEHTINEDQPVTVALAASDVDGDALQFTIETQPLHGAVEIAGDQVTFTPAPNYWGPDSFTFVASDGSSSSSAVISIDVLSINDAPALDTSGTPQLSPVKQNASEPAGDTVADILASGAAGDQIIADVDGDLAGIAIVSVDGSGGTWEYQNVGGSWAALDGIDASAARLLDLDSRLRFAPATGFSGEATLRFRAWDGSVGAAGGTADATAGGGSTAFSAASEEAVITVIPNVPPVAVDDAASTPEDNDVTVDVLANDSDADGEPLTVAIETQPGGGSATLVDGDIQYRPDPNRNGTDTFTYTVRDPRGGVATGTVEVTVTAVNDLPITQDDTETVAEDGIVAFDPTGNDTAGPLDESAGALSVRAVAAPAQHGTAAVTGGKIRYTPALGYTGSDQLTYEVCDDATPALCSAANVTLTVSRVTATVETDPVPHLPEQNPNGSMKVIDAADDPAIWVNPVDPAQSLIIGTSKFSDTSNGGLLVYDLDGNQLSYTNDGTKNNVDLRSGFPLGGREVTLVTASQRNDPPQPKRVAIYTLDPSTKSLTLAGEFTPLFEPLGDCMYRSPTTGHFYVFVASANGWVQQWRLAEAPGGTGAISATEVRSFRVSAVGAPDIVEGCVADDELGHLYVSEEEVGIWRYSAEPEGGVTRTQVDAVGGGQLTADVEGLTIAYAPGGAGYLIAASQGSSSFSVYRRDGDNAFVRSFKIKDGTVDGTTLPDGIDVTTAALGQAFPNGMFVTQDNNNAPDNQNFKLVPLERIFPMGTVGSGAEPVGAGGAALAAGAVWLGLAAIARRRRRSVPSSER